MEAASAEDVSRVFAHEAGRPIRISGAEWRDVSDPAKGPARRSASGGPGALGSMLSSTEKWLGKMGPEVRECRRQDEESIKNLRIEVRKALGRRS